MTLKIAYFQPIIMAMDQIPSNEFSKMFSLTTDLHNRPELHDSDNPFLNIRGGQQIQLYPNTLNIDVSWLVQYIESVCESYMGLASAQSGTSDLTHCKPMVISIWTVRQGPGQYQEMHSHAAGNLSGNLYIQVPELATTSQPSDGQILFRMPQSKDVTKFILNDTWKNTPQAGNIVVFPSFVPHTVYPWQGTGFRTVIGFDAILRPKE